MLVNCKERPPEELPHEGFENNDRKIIFRVSKQEGSFNEERVVKMEEWRCRSAPLEQLFSEQGTKWEDDTDLDSSDLESLRKYKQATQVN